MLSQQRYRTLISSIGKIYSADDTKVRTELLEGALCSVMGIMNPETDAGWRTVSADTDRILRVWESLEESPAAQVVVEQFKDMLRELSSVSMEVDDEMSGTAATTRGMTFQDISSASTVAVLTPTAQRTPMLHRSPALSVASHRSSVPFITLEPPVVVVDHSQPVSVASTAPPSPMLTATEEADDVDMVPPSTAASDEPVVEQPVVSSTTESVLPTVTQAVASMPEVEQPTEEEDAAEEESEEGVEMEQILIRGRTYWFDRDAGKLYAITEDDDIGDEVGEFKGGKVVFYTK